MLNQGKFHCISDFNFKINKARCKLRWKIVPVWPVGKICQRPWQLSGDSSEQQGWAPSPDIIYILPIVPPAHPLCYCPVKSRSCWTIPGATLLSLSPGFFFFSPFRFQVVVWLNSKIPQNPWRELQRNWGPEENMHGNDKNIILTVGPFFKVHAQHRCESTMEFSSSKDLFRSHQKYPDNVRLGDDLQVRAGRTQGPKHTLIQLFC